MNRAALLGLLLLVGCGYSTRSLYDPDIRSVAVNVFTNDTFRRDLELSLTRKVAEQVRLRTPWRIASQNAADAVLTGRIISVHEAVLSETTRDLTNESSVVVTVEALLTDTRTGEVIKRVRRTSSETFLIPRGENVSTALDRSLSNLAEDIVQGLEEWGP